jgi:acyl-CoA reductase-like NAD-dependent aldehyde dehydrogenase
MATATDAAGALERFGPLPGMLIGGELVAASSGASLPCVNPATEEQIAEIPLAAAADVEAAVAAARAALEPWQALSPMERGRRLQAVAQAIEERALDFATLDALDAGNPVRAMLGDVRNAVDALRWFAAAALEVKGSTLHHGRDALVFTAHEPYGVVARILPFNHPFQFVASKIAAPLMAGNAVILKPAEQTSLSALHFGALLQPLLPPGVVNVVTGLGAEAGDALVRHPRVPRVAFTGSSATGEAVLAAAAGEVKEVTLELGGKNPMVVLPDADLDAAVPAAVASMNFRRTQGQSCQSTSRLFLHDAVADEFLRRLRAEVERLRVGDPLADGVDMGPLAYAAHYERVRACVAAGVAEGATLVTGGDRPAGLARGYFLAPTVFADVDPGMSLAREEIFGPVLSVLRWRELDEVVELANGLRYGLTANVWTRDLSAALALAHRIEAGYVWVNGVGARWSGAPFGGWKHSGIGKEGSVEEIYSYTRQKSVHVVL